MLILLSMGNIGYQRYFLYGHLKLMNLIKLLNDVLLIIKVVQCAQIIKQQIVHNITPLIINNYKFDQLGIPH